MKQWYSPKDLSGLPGLPTTDRRIRSKASKEKWTSRKKSKGKGFEYHVSSLPESARQALENQPAITVLQSEIEKDNLAQRVQQQLEIQAALEKQEQDKKLKAVKDKEAAMRLYSSLPDTDPRKVTAKARLNVIRMWQAHKLEYFVGKGNEERSRTDFCDKVMSNEIELPSWIMERMPKRNGVHTLNKESLQRWADDYRNHGISKLMTNYGTRRNQSIIEKDQDLKVTVLDLIIDQPHITNGKIKTILEAVFADKKIPSTKAIQTWVKNWKAENQQFYLYLTNPDRWKNVCKVAFGSHHERIERLNQVWEFDSTPGDRMLTDGRHSVIGVIDMYSRRVRLVVSKTSKASAVCLVLRRAILDWGVPEIARTDNGKDYVSEQFTFALENLEIGHELCLPFASEQKGTIERFFRTMSHGILDLLPGFIGHNVAERKEIEARKSFAERIMSKDELVDVALSSEELQKILNQWVEHIYHQDSHSGLESHTPFEVATSFIGDVRRIRDERALDFLLAEIAKHRPIFGKKGVRYNNHFYFNEACVRHIGENAIIRIDESDIGRVYLYRELTNEFVGVAECPELLGISGKERANAASAAQKKFLAQQAKERKQHKRHINKNTAQIVLEHRINNSPDVTVLPTGSTYTTHALDEAAKAAKALDTPENQPDIIDREALEAEIKEFSKPKKAEVLEFASSHDAYRHWARVQQQIDAGEITDEKTLKACKLYFEVGEGQEMKELFEDFELPITG